MDEDLGFSQQFNERYSSRSAQVNLLNNLLDSGSDMSIQGPSGCGKTLLIRDLLVEKNIISIKINCLQCSTKQTLVQRIIEALSQKFNLKLKPAKKVNQLVHAIRTVDAYLEKYEVEVDGHVCFTLRDNPSTANAISSASVNSNRLYFVLDNIEKLNVSSKFIGQILSLREQLQLNISFIFIGVSFSYELTMHSCTLTMIPTIVLTPLSDKDLLRITKNHLEMQLSGYEHACFLTFHTKFLQDLVANFKVLVRSANTMNTLALRLFRVFISPLVGQKPQPTPSVKEFVNLVKSETYVLARKLLLQDPYLNEGDEREFLEKITSHRYENDATSNTLNTSSQGCRIPFYSAVILVACWVGNRSSEALDRKLFKDYKGKSGRGAGRIGKKIDSTNLKSVKLDRLIGLAQSILSQAEYADKLKSDLDISTNPEIDAYDQTADFYSQIAALVDMKYIQIYNIDHSLAKAQFISNLDEQTIRQIDATYKLRLVDYFSKKE